MNYFLKQLPIQFAADHQTNQKTDITNSTPTLDAFGFDCCSKSKVSHQTHLTNVRPQIFCWQYYYLNEALCLILILRILLSKYTITIWIFPLCMFLNINTFNWIHLESILKVHVLACICLRLHLLWPSLWLSWWLYWIAWLILHSLRSWCTRNISIFLCFFYKPDLKESP